MYFFASPSPTVSCSSLASAQNFSLITVVARHHGTEKYASGAIEVNISNSSPLAYIRWCGTHFSGAGRPATRLRRTQSCSLAWWSSWFWSSLNRIPTSCTSPFFSAVYFTFRLAAMRVGDLAMIPLYDYIQNSLRWEEMRAYSM